MRNIFRLRGRNDLAMDSSVAGEAAGGRVSDRLRPQPGGFEGLPAFSIKPDRHGLPSLQLPQPGDAPIDSGPTRPAVSLAVKQCHHGIARDARLLDVPKVALPNLSHSFIEPSNPG